MYIIIVLSFLFYTYTYYYILLIIFSRDYLEIFGGRFGRIWMAPVINADVLFLHSTLVVHTGIVYCDIYQSHCSVWSVY